MILFIQQTPLWAYSVATNGRLPSATASGETSVSPTALDSLNHILLESDDSVLVNEGFEVAAGYWKLHQFDKAQQLYKHLEEASKALDDSVHQAKALYHLALAYRNQGVTHRSLEHLFKALSISEKIQNLELSTLIYIQIGSAKKDQGLITESIDYFNRALTLAKQLGNTHNQASIYNNMGSAFKLSKQYAKAKEYFLQAIDINKAAGNLRYLGYNYNNLANIYEETNDLENARIYHEKSIELKAETGDWPSLAISYSNLALVYMKLEQLPKALSYVHKSLELAEAYEVAEILPIVYSQHALILSQKGDFKRAFAVMQKLNNYKDSIALVDQKAIISDMEARYERQTIQNENELLRKDIALSEAELLKKDAFIIAFALCTGILIIVVVLYFLSYKSRTESNQKLLEQNKAIKAQKDRIERQKQKIEESTLRLERIRKDKEVFFSTISHDMRGPLNAIAAIVGLMKDEEESSFEEELLVLDYSANALSALVEDIMDFSNLESGRLHIDSKPVNIINLLGEVCKTFAFISNEKQVDLLFEHNDFDQNVISDPKRIRQVMFNLLGNAFKFTQEGFVKLEINGQPSGHGQVNVNITVSDTGIGIPEDKLDLIFNKFAQANDEVYRDFGGSGLGLYISKTLIESMGGTISVDSRVGEGTTFRIDWILELTRQTSK